MAENNEGSPWFWKIFGGTILGAVTFLLLAHITNINMSIERSKNETKEEISYLKMELKDLRIILDHNRERVVMLEQSGVKEKIMTLEQSIKENTTSLDSNNQKTASLEVTITHTKEELKTIQDQNFKLTEQIQQVREKLASPKVEEKKPEGGT